MAAATRQRLRKERSASSERETAEQSAAALPKPTKKPRQSGPKKACIPPPLPVFPSLDPEADIRQESQQSQPQTAPRYSTRESTRGRRPAVEAGLAPRRREDIQAEAQAKRDKIAAEQAARETEKVVERAARTKQVKKIASMMDHTARKESEAVVAFDQYPGDGDSDVEMLEVGDPGARGNGGGDEGPQVQTLRSAEVDSHSAPAHEPTTPQPRHAPISRRGAQRARQEHSESDFEDDNDGDQSSGEHSIRSNEGDSMPDNAGAPKKRLSRATKRVVRQQNTRAELASHRENITPGEVKGGNRASHSTTVLNTTSSPGCRQIHEDAFNDEWRRQLREKTVTPARHNETPGHRPPHSTRTPRLTLTKSRPAVFLTGSPAPARSKKAASRRWEDQNENFEPEGGFSADDIRADRSLVLSRAHQRGARYASAQDSINIEEVAEPQRNDAAGKKKRKNKKTKSKAANKDTEDESDGGDADQSKKIKAELLPKWSKPRIKQRVVPSLCQYFGIQDSSWSLDTEEYKFLELVQVVLNDVFPERHHQLTKKDIIYRWCRQQVYEWRRGFQLTAKALVQTEMSARQEDETLSLRQRSPAGICDWLDDAISLGGEAIFGRPNVIEPRDAQDQLQSRFVLKVMAYHIGATLGSVFDSDEGDQPLPVGALALAACAVERAFLWYKDDQPKGLPMTPFSRNHAGKDTGKWRETAVQELVDRTHRFERLLSRARALVTVVPPPALPSGTTQQGSATNRLYVRERSSSPPVASLYDDE